MKTRITSDSSMAPRIQPRPASNRSAFLFPEHKSSWSFGVVFGSVLFGWFLLSALALAQSTFEITPQIDQLIRTGQMEMYNCEFSSADRKFDELIKRFPDHPAGYMYRAEVYWWRVLRDPSNKVLEENFDRYTDMAIAKGEALVRSNPRDFYAQLFLASAYGNRTRFNVLVTRSYYGAMRSGLKAKSYNAAASALKPGYVDCLIGSGSFNYFAGSLPAVIKPFAWMFGAHGDKDKGLKQLEQAAQKGEFGQTEAKTVLLGVYVVEKRTSDYRQLLNNLIEQYPGNHVFYMWLADAFLAQKEIKEGIDFYARLLDRDKDNPGIKVSRGYAYFEKGRLEAGFRRLDEATASFNLAIQSAGEDNTLLAPAHLWRGYAADLKGNRDGALTDYRRVLSLPNVNETHRQAQRFLKTPYKGASS